MPHPFLLEYGGLRSPLQALSALSLGTLVLGTKLEARKGKLSRNLFQRLSNPEGMKHTSSGSTQFKCFSPFSRPQTPFRPLPATRPRFASPRLACAPEVHPEHDLALGIQQSFHLRSQTNVDLQLLNTLVVHLCPVLRTYTRTPSKARFL